MPVEGVLNPNTERKRVERGGSAGLPVEGVLNPNNCSLEERNRTYKTY